MNLAVAVGAVRRDHEAVDSRVCCIGVIQEAADMRSTQAGGDTRVALLAQLWPGLVQQCSMIRAVNVMAQGAVFGGRLVLPQERPSLFGVAAVTVFINRELLQ